MLFQHLDHFNSFTWIYLVPHGQRICGNYYGLVIVDDYSRFCWTIFLPSKDEMFSAFTRFAKLAQNKLNSKMIAIWSDHGGEFENHLFEEYCDKFGIEHNFSAPITPNKMALWRVKIVF